MLALSFISRVSSYTYACFLARAWVLSTVLLALIHNIYHLLQVSPSWLMFGTWHLRWWCAVGNLIRNRRRVVGRWGTCKKSSWVNGRSDVVWLSRSLHCTHEIDPGFDHLLPSDQQNQTHWVWYSTFRQITLCYTGWQNQTWPGYGRPSIGCMAK